MDTNIPIQTVVEGIVVRKVRGCYFVLSEAGLVPCVLSTALRRKLNRFMIGSPVSRGEGSRRTRLSARDPVAINDRVRYIDNGNGDSTIVSLLPRRNKFSRRAAGRIPVEQVIVANVDLVIPVFSAAQPKPKWNLLDRYLVSAEASGLSALICLTKQDLMEAGDGVHRELENYRRVGYPLVYTSTIDNQGVDALRSALRGRVSVLIGKSGVGKTSLLNAMEPGLGLKVRAVSQATSKGRHTTTHLEMFPLKNGGWIVDTPGMREFGLWDVERAVDDLAVYFPELRPLVGKCRFGLSCRHVRESGCMVQQALKDGLVSRRRYDSYLKLQRG